MRRNLAGVGELTEIISLESNTTAADGQGGSASTWSAYAADIWAKVDPMRGSERLSAETDRALALYVVTIRARDDVVATHRVKWGSRYLNIRFVRGRGSRDIYLAFEAELGVASA